MQAVRSTKGAKAPRCPSVAANAAAVAAAAQAREVAAAMAAADKATVKQLVTTEQQHKSAVAFHKMATQLGPEETHKALVTISGTTKVERVVAAQRLRTVFAAADKNRRKYTTTTEAEDAKKEAAAAEKRFYLIQFAVGYLSEEEKKKRAHAKDSAGAVTTADIVSTNRMDLDAHREVLKHPFSPVNLHALVGIFDLEKREQKMLYDKVVENCAKIGIRLHVFLASNGWLEVFRPRYYPVTL